MYVLSIMTGLLQKTQLTPNVMQRGAKIQTQDTTVHLVALVTTLPHIYFPKDTKHAGSDIMSQKKELNILPLIMLKNSNKALVQNTSPALQLLVFHKSTKPTNF